MLGTIRYVIGILVFLGIYATVLAPAADEHGIHGDAR